MHAGICTGPLHEGLHGWRCTAVSHVEIARLGGCTGALHGWLCTWVQCTSGGKVARGVFPPAPFSRRCCTTALCTGRWGGSRAAAWRRTAHALNPTGAWPRQVPEGGVASASEATPLPSPSRHRQVWAWPPGARGRGLEVTWVRRAGRGGRERPEPNGAERNRTEPNGTERWGVREGGAGITPSPPPRGRVHVGSMTSGIHMGGGVKLWGGGGQDPVPGGGGVESSLGLPPPPGKS